MFRASRSPPQFGSTSRRSSLLPAGQQTWGVPVNGITPTLSKQMSLRLVCASRSVSLTSQHAWEVLYAKLVCVFLFCVGSVLRCLIREALTRCVAIFCVRVRQRKSRRSRVTCSLRRAMRVIPHLSATCLIARRCRQRLAAARAHSSSCLLATHRYRSCCCLDYFFFRQTGSYKIIHKNRFDLTFTLIYPGNGSGDQRNVDFER